MDFNFHSPFWGVIILLLLFGVVDRSLQKKRMARYYAQYFLWIALTPLFVAWQPLGFILFLLFTLLAHVYFAGVYSRMNEKKYSFLDHLAGYANWEDEQSLFAASPRFMILLACIGFLLILFALGQIQLLWFPVALFLGYLFFMNIGYQTERKKRSKK